MVFANQKIITIHKARQDQRNTYGAINKECMYQASQELKYNEFRIYMYMAVNQDGYEFPLSTNNIAAKMGANKREVQKSINTLIQKGYLIQENENRYMFLEDASRQANTDMLENNGVGIAQCVNDSCPNVESPRFVCAKSPQEYESNPHTYNNNNKDSKLDKLEAPPNERTSGQEKGKTDACRPDTPSPGNADGTPSSFNDVGDVPYDIIMKVVGLYQQGLKYNKSSPQIQQATGLNGRVIYQIIEMYRKGEVRMAQAEEDGTILRFDSNDGYISVQNIKDTLEERGLSESDEEGILEVYGEYYDVAAANIYDIAVVDAWFSKHFNYTHRS